MSGQSMPNKIQFNPNYTWIFHCSQSSVPIVDGNKRFFRIGKRLKTYQIITDAYKIKG